MRTIALVVAMMVGALAIARADPAPFVVNSTTDARDANLGDGKCATIGGVCTLRAAIQEANALGGSNIIQIQLIPGTYTLTIAGTNEDEAATGDLDITHDITITRTGAGLVVVDGGLVDRVFDILAGATVAISQIIIQNGSTAADGGGVRNTGTLTLNEVALVNNTADSGGGIDNFGAGIMQLTNVTLSGNAANDRGGAIFNDRGGSMQLTNVTISDNTGPMPTGSGIDNFGAAEVENTIVNGTCAGMAIDSLGHNISASDSGTCGFDGAGDLSSVSLAALALGPLQDNGGFTLTQAPLAGSVAIDAGNDADCPGTDQRGHLRPADGDHDGSAACDVGAYEVDGPVPPTSTPRFTPTVTNTPVPTGTPTATSPPTSTSTPLLPTRTPGGALVILGTATGSPGDEVTFDATLSAGTVVVTGAQNDITFDSVDTPIAADANGEGKADCFVNPTLNKQYSFTFLPFPCAGAACTTVRAAVYAFPASPIPDGSVLYSCKVTIAPSAPLGEYPLTIGRISLTDLQLATIPGAGTDGKIVVVPPSTATPTATFTPTITPTPSSTNTPTVTLTPTATRIPCRGDCNGSDTVTVDEILTLINIALGNASADGCKAGDTNNDQQITIDEIIAAVNNALNGCPPSHA